MSEKPLRIAYFIDSYLEVDGVANYLRTNMKRCYLTGVLTGEDLARAYANMDLFVFPSKTDTFGNVVLEALSCGVPALVADEGGPQFIVKTMRPDIFAGTTRSSSNESYI